jgi:hypothetical protein
MDTQTEAAYDGKPAGKVRSSEGSAVEIRRRSAVRGCGSSSQVATFRVYGLDPGFVGRCPSCERAADAAGAYRGCVWLDISGMSALAIPLTTNSHPGNSCRATQRRAQASNPKKLIGKWLLAYTAPCERRVQGARRRDEESNPR